MSRSRPFDYSHRERGNVVVQDLTGWTGDTEGMDEVESEWLSVAGRDHVTGSVTEFGPEIALGRETQEHIAEEWTGKAEEAGIDRIAFVSDGLKARAVGSNLDGSQEIRAFGSLDEAVAWAGE